MAKQLDLFAIKKAVERLRDTIANPALAGTRKTHIHTPEGVKEIEVSYPEVAASFIIGLDADRLRELLTPNRPDYARGPSPDDIRHNTRGSLQLLAKLYELWVCLTDPSFARCAAGENNNLNKYVLFFDELLNLLP